MFPCSHSLFPSPSSGNSSCPLIGPPTEPRFESRRCDLCQSQEEKQTDLPTHLKVANRSGLVAEGSPARAGAERSEREKGGDFAPGDSKGRSPWRAFGDFPRVGKVTRGGGAERPPHRGVQRGLRPLASSGPGAEGRSALLIGNRDCRPAKTPG